MATVEERRERVQFALAWLGALVLCAVAAHFYSSMTASHYSLQRSERYLVDLNRAGVDDLCLLPGIGPTLARRIVQERRATGDYADLEDLERRVTGIGPRTREALQDLARFSAER